MRDEEASFFHTFYTPGLYNLTEKKKKSEHITIMQGNLPPGWMCYQSPQGHPYYFHVATNTTQWHHPSHPSPSAPPPPTAPSGYPGGAHAAPSGYPGAGGGGHYAGASSSAAAPAAAAAASSSTGSRYVYNTAVEFKLKEKAFSMSGDGFSIKNTTTGAAAFKVKGTVISMSDKKKLVDATTGAAIYTMVESLLTLRGRMNIVDSKTKKPVVCLRKKGFIPMMGTGTVQIWRGGSDDGDPWLVCKGDYFRKNFDFKEKSSGRVLASVRRKSMNMANILLEKDTYIIRVEPGVDVALMVFLVIALDEQYRDDGNRTGLESRLGGFF